MKLKSMYRSALLIAALAGMGRARADVVYVTDASRIARIDSSGNVSTFVAATASNGITRPMGLTADSQGNLYASNGNNDDIIKVTPTGATSIFASGSAGPPFLNEPYSLAADSHDNIYAANFASGGPLVSVIKITPAGTTSVFATGLDRPRGIAVDGGGNVYTADFFDNTVTRITPAGLASTFATGLNQPAGLTFGSDGKLYVADFGNDSILDIDSGGVHTFVSGLISGPNSLAFDSSNNIYASLAGANMLVRVTPDGTVSTFATGLNQPTGLIVQAPEPVGSGLVALAILGAFHRVRSAAAKRSGMQK